MATYTFTRSGAYEFNRDGTGSVTSVGTNGSFRTNGTLMGYSSFDISAFQTMRGSGAVSVSNVSVRFQASDVSTYEVSVQATDSHSGSAAGVILGTVSCHNSGWTTLTVVGASANSYITSAINNGNNTLWVACENVDQTITDDIRCRYFELTITYEFFDQTHAIRDYSVTTSVVLVGDTAKLSLRVTNVAYSVVEPNPDVAKYLNVYLAKKVDMTSYTRYYEVGSLCDIQIDLDLGESSDTLDIEIPLDDEEEYLTDRTTPLSLLVRIKNENYDEICSDVRDGVLTAVSNLMNPAITDFSLERCDSTGTKCDDGIYVCTDCKLSLDGSTVDTFTLKVYYDEGVVDISSSPYVTISLTDSNLADFKAGYVDSTTLITQTFVASKDYAFKIVLTDGYETATGDSAIFKAFANVHLSGATTGGVRLGGISRSTENNPLFECEYPASFAGTMSATGAITASGGITGCDYSTTETATPFKWIDGKTVYRRVFYHEAVGTNFPNTFYFSTIPDLDVVIRCTGVVWNPGCSGQYLPIPYNVGGSNWVDIQIQGDQGNLVYMYQGTGQSIQKAYIIVEYTKTTT